MYINLQVFGGGNEAKVIKTSSHEYIKDTAPTGYLQSFIKAYSSVSACALSTILY